jgi:hypothetical protein
VPAATSAATASPKPTPILPPPPPLAIIQGLDSSVVAVDGAGHVQWSITPTALDSLLTAATGDGITARTAGPNVILSHIPAQSQGIGNLVVLDRSGRRIGAGSFTANRGDHVFGSPAGTEWAWSVTNGPTTDSLRGQIMVAGIGVAAHTVFSWVAPPGASDELVAGWTDMGIVMERIGLGGCGAGFHPDTASFLVDPVSGALTTLFTNGDHYGDARRDVRVAFAARSASRVIIDGATFDEAGSVANSVYVSPDGGSVGIQRFSLAGCGGTAPTLHTEVVDVTRRSHSDVAGCGITGWFDATHFVCEAFNDATQKLEGIDGKAGPFLGRGSFAGVVAGA